MRKAQLGFLIFLVLIVVFSISAIFGRVALSTIVNTAIDDELANTTVTINGENRTLDQQITQTETFYEVSDYGFLFMIIGYAIICFILSAMSKQNSLLFALNFLFLIFVIISSVYIKDAYTDLKTMPEFETDFNAFPITNLGFTYLPHITVIIWLISLIIGQGVGN